MINKWKVLGHRLGGEGGRCRDCGRHDATSAPKTCTRCALERFRNQGLDTIVNPVAAFEEQGREMWRVVAQQLRSGELRSDSFYLFVGHGDGGPLERPLDELAPGERRIAHAGIAHETGLDLARRYRQVWVVTTVGGWSVSSALTHRGGRDDPQ